MQYTSFVLCPLSSISTSLLSGLLSLTSSLRCFLKFSFMLGIILIQLILREMVHDSCVIRERECQEDMSVYLVQKHQTSTTTDLFQESCHDKGKERASSSHALGSSILLLLVFVFRNRLNLLFVLPLISLLCVRQSPLSECLQFFSQNLSPNFIFFTSSADFRGRGVKGKELKLKESRLFSSLSV